jgi:hypothetical protein
MVRRLVHQGGDAGVEQRHRDEPAPSRLSPPDQRGLDGVGRVQAADHVQQRDADLRRLAAGMSGDAHQSGQRLHDDVVPRPRGSALALAERGE